MGDKRNTDKPPRVYVPTRMSPLAIHWIATIQDAVTATTGVRPTRSAVIRAALFVARAHEDEVRLALRGLSLRPTGGTTMVRDSVPHVDSAEMPTEEPRPDPMATSGLLAAGVAQLWEKRCVFCPIIVGDAPANVVERGERHIAFVPMGPHVPGHVLFVPTDHLPDATVNPGRTGEVVAEAARYVAERSMDANIITSVGTAATQSVPHLHVHVIPRGPDDGLPKRWPWIPER